jgi:tetratricopeptide (TPR) repeat protein
LLVLATGAVFAKALDGEFVYDDLHLAVANPALAGPRELFESLKRPYWAFLEGESSTGVGYWRPLASVALFAGNALSQGLGRLGFEAPFGFHLLSLVLHLAATACAYRLVLGLVGSAWAAGGGAALFALHPVQVEAVAWISAVNDPLAGLCVIAGLDAFRRWREEGSIGPPSGAAVWLALGLLGKESALCLIPLAMALDFARPMRASFGQGYGAFALVIAAWWGLRALVFGSPWGGFDQVTAHLYVSSARALSLRAELFGGALGLLVWPARLNLFREVRPEVPPGDPALVRAWIAIGVYAAAVLVAALSKRRTLCFALLIPLAALAPALIGFESVGRFPLSERFLYVAVLAPALAWALLVDRPRLPRPAMLAATVVLAAFLGWKSHARTKVWRDELSLFRSAVAASPKSAYVRWGLGRVLLEEFQRTGDRVTLEEGYQAFQAAQDICSPPDGARDPSVLTTDYDEIQASLGVGWFFLLCAEHDPGDCSFEEAELVFGEIAKRTAGTPYRLSHARAQTGLGIARSYLGRKEEAELALTEATNLAPELAEAWFARAELARQSGEWVKAEESYRRALERVPNDPEARTGLAQALIAQGRAGEAQPLLERVLAADPESAGAYVELGVLAGQAGRLDEALAHFDQALSIDPELAAAHLNRGKALVQLGRDADAVLALQAACRADPRSFEAHYNLGVLLLNSGLAPEGCGHLRAALDLEPEHELAAEIGAALRQACGEH